MDALAWKSRPRVWRAKARLAGVAAFVLGVMIMSTAMYIERGNREVAKYLETVTLEISSTSPQQTTSLHPSSTHDQTIDGEQHRLQAMKDKIPCENGITSNQRSRPQYSSFECRDDGVSTFHGLSGVYGFPIVNRSCLYHDVLFDPTDNKFRFYAPDTAENRALVRRKAFLPVVNLASRPYDLPILHRKRVILKRKVGWTYEYAPEVVLGTIPRCVELDNRVVGYYTPIVAPWNFAHTLFCDLFSLFWAMHEFNMTNVLDMQVVATSSHYMSEFPVPDTKRPNRAFEFFSQRQPMYDVMLPKRVYASLVVGSGTKSWSWVTPEYAASGNTQLWQAFRRHVIAVTGATDRTRTPLPVREHASNNNVADGDAHRPIHVSICRKKDKRGVVNYEETLTMLESAFPNRKQITFGLEGAVGRSAQEQVQMMIDADVYMCNEGTLATPFMFMPAGAVFVSLPLVYHAAHLHQRKMPDARTWWRLPDMMRPDPRKNTGGNIDWFPPAIRWVKTMWYHAIPLNETQIQYPLMHLRNYMPDMNIVIQEHRIVALMKRAVKFLEAKDAGVWRVDDTTGEITVEDVSSPLLEEDDGGSRPLGYSINANLCRQMLLRDHNLTAAFNSARCFYSMSWLCEMWTNTKLKWRRLHEKWSLSKGRCGDRRTALEYLPMIVDPRNTARNISDYLYYTKEELRASYQTLDLGNFTVTDEEMSDVFPLP
ncbi:transmembrane protein, putative [Bodo saltans]|uniref:Transmembrane protein, putative n=2 Tax=Bodo saltans TaxID=75058 RepID=A0A0S4J8X5_BODSA|nr:transmembrane protein, putative [Bodo saltans]|eukprot:CUG83857.1 transmembrane protein, putative [Bodo saltans]